MRRFFTRSFTVSFGAAAVAIAVLACSQDGRAATAEAPKARTAATQLFREAAANAPAAEAGVPVQASLAPLIDRLRSTVVNISTTTVTKHPRVEGGPRGRGGPGGGSPRGGPGGQDFDEFFERYFGRPAPGPQAPEEFKGSSLGSGFVLNNEGFILTNNHVVKDATDIRVRLFDGRDYGAKIIGRDPLTDVALIQLNNPPKDLPSVGLGDSDVLRQGDFVLALGSPFGLRDTATLGIVSAKHRAGINPGGTYDDFIQTDAAINPGNSGGPLFNLRGEVVGINTAIVSPQIGQGIGFAVPISLAKAILPQLREKGKVTRGFMGVSVSDLSPDLVQGFGLPETTKGALVQNVVPKSPAAKAGVEAGDVVLSLNGKAVDSSGALTRGVALIPPGASADLTVLRNGQKKQLSVKVAQRPEDEGAVGRGEFDEQGNEDQAGKKDQSPRLGVSLSRITPEIARELNIEGQEGAVVVDVTDNSPADRAGLRRGDVIVQIAGKPVKAPEDVKAALAAHKDDGKPLVLRVRRGDQATFVAVPLTQR
jgi:serine protease Do